MSVFIHLPPYLLQSFVPLGTQVPGEMSASLPIIRLYKYFWHLIQPEHLAGQWSYEISKRKSALHHSCWERRRSPRGEWQPPPLAKVLPMLLGGCPFHNLSEDSGINCSLGTMSQAGSGVRERAEGCEKAPNWKQEEEATVRKLEPHTAQPDSSGTRKSLPEQTDQPKGRDLRYWLGWQGEERGKEIARSRIVSRQQSPS